MYKDVQIAAIIPARKGSKGFPNKNMSNLLGMPLIEYSIIEAEKSLIIDKIIISTDSEEILKIALEHNLEMKGLRPDEFSSDTANLYDVIKYEITNHQLVEKGFVLIVLLQPTSPLRQSYMIDEALIKFIDKNQKSAVSVSEVEENLVFMRTIDEEGKLVKILDMESTIRRQDLPKFYKVNGMIYINKISDIVNNYVSLNDNQSPIIISKEYNVDIDDSSDLVEATNRLRQIVNRK